VRASKIPHMTLMDNTAEEHPMTAATNTDPREQLAHQVVEAVTHAMEAFGASTSSFASLATSSAITVERPPRSG
jgi:hypothetical protein